MSKKSIDLCIQKKRSFSVVPDDVFKDKNMSELGRLVTAFLIGRPDGWLVRVSWVMKEIGLSEARWRRARLEMQRAGYFVQKRERGEDGQWVWSHFITDTPATIPPKSTDGSSTDGSSTDGSSVDGQSIHGQTSNLTEKIKQSIFSKEDELEEF